jgi:hypothetical protein
MSDGEIHEVSRMLGELIAEQKAAAIVRERLFEKLDVTTEKLVKTVGVLEAHIQEDKVVHARVHVIEEKLSKEVEPDLNSFREIKRRAVWLIGIFATIGGLFGSGAGKVLSKLGGGGE